MEKDFESAIETIGQLLFEADITTGPATNLLSNVREAYVVVRWPESQAFMDEEWFEEEAILDVECKFGSSAYLIPLKYVI